MTNGQPDLLSGLPQADAERVLALGTPVSVNSGAVLFPLGAPADHVYLITRGRIRLTLPMTVRGQEENVLVEERGPGQTVGWSALIPPYRFTLAASAPLATEVLALPRQALLAHFAASPAAGYAVTMNLASVIGQRLQLFQAMWLREMERMVELRCA